MTAYMEMHNSSFGGDSLDKDQISDYTNVLLVTNFLESMVPILQWTLHHSSDEIPVAMKTMGLSNRT